MSTRHKILQIYLLLVTSTKVINIKDIKSYKYKILVTSTNVINIKVSFAKKNSERNKKMNQFTKKLAVTIGKLLVKENVM